MGSIKGKFIKGAAGSLVYREYRGEQIIQGKPNILKSHRTEGTKKAAKTFGKASKLAHAIRWGQGYVCGEFYDGTMNFRLNTEVLRCLNTVKDAATQQFNYTADTFRTLAGFEFNVGSTVKDNFFVQPIVTIDGITLKVAIPDIKIPLGMKFPKDRLKCCRLVLVTSMIDLSKGKTNFGKPQIMEIPYTYEPSVVPGQTFEFEILPGCLCIIGVSLRYIEQTFVGENVLNNKTFNPAAILHAEITDGVNDSDFHGEFYEFDRPRPI